MLVATMHVPGRGGCQQSGRGVEEVRTFIIPMVWGTSAHLVACVPAVPQKTFRLFQNARELQFKGMGHSGPARGTLAGGKAEGTLVGAEQQVIPLAQRNAKVTQGAFGPGALGDTATVRCKVHLPKLVSKLVSGFAMVASIDILPREGGEIIAVNIFQGTLGHILVRARFGSRPCAGRGTRYVRVSATENHRRMCGVAGLHWWAHITGLCVCL